MEANLSDVFSLKKIKEEGQNVMYEGVINKEHWIYKAHFPGRPITPGAVILRALQTIVEEKLSALRRITFVKSIRFLKTLSPDIEKVNFNLQIMPAKEAEYSAEIQGVVESGPTIFAKFRFFVS